MKLKMCKAGILTIGDELLYGQTVDTNSAWIGRQLADEGISLIEKRTVCDDRKAVIQALDSMKNHTDLLLITGGLGPTRDDLTKEVLADYFSMPLRFEQAIYDHLSQYRGKKSGNFLELNKVQAWIPDGASFLTNNLGTAPGLWILQDDWALAAMPGVPFEMKKMFGEQLLPLLRKAFQLEKIHHRHIQTIGLPESRLAQMLSSFEEQLPDQVTLAYLPSVAHVKLRLTGLNEKQLEEQFQKLIGNIREHVFSTDPNETIELVNAKKLCEKGYRLVSCESCTGGYIAHQITQNPGSSDYFEGGIVVYSNSLKVNILGVSPESLNTHGAVSEKVVAEMAIGGVRQLNADIALSVSGIAGPKGGTEEKPVGTICFGICTPDGYYTEQKNLKGDRIRIIQRSHWRAMQLLWLYLNGRLELKKL